MYNQYSTLSSWEARSKQGWCWKTVGGPRSEVSAHLKFLLSALRSDDLSKADHFAKTQNQFEIDATLRARIKILGKIGVYFCLENSLYSSFSSPAFPHKICRVPCWIRRKFSIISAMASCLGTHISTECWTLAREWSFSKAKYCNRSFTW